MAEESTKVHDLGIYAHRLTKQGASAFTNLGDVIDSMISNTECGGGEDEVFDAVEGELEEYGSGGAVAAVLKDVKALRAGTSLDELS